MDDRTPSEMSERVEWPQEKKFMILSFKCLLVINNLCSLLFGDCGEGMKINKCFCGEAIIKIKNDCIII